MGAQGPPGQRVSSSAILFLFTVNVLLCCLMQMENCLKITTQSMDPKLGTENVFP